MRQATFVNLTPHRVDLVLSGDRRLCLPPSGAVTRVKMRCDGADEVSGVPVVHACPEALEGLPEAVPGVMFVVSTFAAQAAAALGRVDVVAPDTGPDSALRDADGRIVGVRRFQRFATAQAVGPSY